MVISDSTTLAALKLATDAYKEASRVFNTPAMCWKHAREQLVKKAEFGENQNPQFERVFGSIAFTYLQEKAPGLVPYIQGFQLLDREPDGNKAVGAFVAEVGDKVIDIPMFFVNGELRGHQVMRLRSPELYLPLRESFLDYLFSRLPQDLGEVGRDQALQPPSQSTPDIQPFSGSRFAKGAAELPWVRSWAHEAGLLQAWAEMVYQPKNLKLAIAATKKEPNQHVDLLGILQKPENLGLLKTAAKLADEYPLFKEVLDKAMGSDWLQRAAKHSAASMPTNVRRLDTPINRPLQLKRASVDQRELFTTRNLDRLTFAGFDRQKVAAELDQYGDVMIDNRPTEKLARAFEIEEQDVTVESPDIPGVYNVLDANRKRRKMVVYPSFCRKGNGPYDLIIDAAGGKWCEVPRDRYMAFPQDHTLNFYKDTPVKAFKNKKSRPSEADVFVVPYENSILGPYYCKREIGRDRYEIEDLAGSYVINDHTSNNYPSPVGCCGSSDKHLLFVDSQSESCSTVGPNQVTIGKKTPIYVLGNHRPDDYNELYFPSYTRGARDMFQLEVFDRAQSRLDDFYKFANLTVIARDNGTVEINDVPTSPGNARRYLTHTVGLSKDAAEQIISDRKLTRYIVVQPNRDLTDWESLRKLGAIQPMVEFPETSEPYGSESGAYSIERPEEAYSMSEPLPTKEPMLPWQEPQMGQEAGFSPEMQQVAQGPGGDIMGDMVGLISILRNHRIDTSIKALSKSLISAIDKLGRQLILFHAHREAHEDLYGDEDAADLESAMTTTFEQAGDLFIKLTRRSNDPNPELDIANLPE